MSFDLATAPFAPTSPWNTPVGANANYTPINWPASTGYNYSVAGGDGTAGAPPVYVANDATDPLVQVSIPASWGYPAETVAVHVPVGATGAGGVIGGDNELVVIDGTTAYNFYQFNRTSDTTATANAQGRSDVVTGTGWGTSSPFLSAGTTASGSSELGGLLVQAETDTGQINHALQLTVDSTLVSPGAVGPAINSDGGSPTGIVQEGEHLAIPLNTPMPSGLSPLGQEVFHAMQQYGAYVVDVSGGVTNLRAQSNAYYNVSTLDALWHDLGNIDPLLQQVSGGTGSAGGTSTGGTVGTGGTTGTGTGTGSTGGTTDPGGTGGTVTGTGGTGGTTGTGTGGTTGTGSTGGTGSTTGTGGGGHHHHHGWTWNSAGTVSGTTHSWSGHTGVGQATDPAPNSGQMSISNCCHGQQTNGASQLAGMLNQAQTLSPVSAFSWTSSGPAGGAAAQASTVLNQLMADGSGAKTSVFGEAGPSPHGADPAGTGSMVTRPLH